MPGERPHIVQRQDDRFGAGEFGNRQVVEEIRVGAVDVDHVCLGEWRELGDLEGADAVDVVQAQTPGNLAQPALDELGLGQFDEIGRVDGLSSAGDRGLDARLLQGAMETIGGHDAAAAVGSAVFVNQKNVHLRLPWESHRLRPPADVLAIWIRIRSRGSVGRLGSKAGSSINGSVLRGDSLSYCAVNAPGA